MSRARSVLLNVDDRLRLLVSEVPISGDHRRVEVRFAELIQVSAYALSDGHDLDVTGSEDDLHQRILEQPALVEAGFQPRATARETSAGSVDIYGIDPMKRPSLSNANADGSAQTLLANSPAMSLPLNANAPPKQSEASSSLHQSPTGPRPNLPSTTSNGSRSIQTAQYTPAERPPPPGTQAAAIRGEGLGIVGILSKQRWRALTEALDELVWKVLR